MASHFQSSGRGGAGNIVDSSKSPQLKPEDLQTPTLKTSMVTTGRGGTGNFAAGLDAEEKRRRQDVEPVVRRDSHGAMHIGRGGTGNVVKTGGAEDGAPLARMRSPAPPAADKDKDNKDKEKTATGPPGSTKENGRGDDDDDDDDDKDVAVPAAGSQPASEEIGWAEKGKNFLLGKK
ncbi:hypothetical protein MYCTH_2294987 [Thermothelomyces thermophilus ATCC 42464]|uniref:Uncharacterized protein n=1 Tax=Thermothelomyces thermophilus (strain ATCC 42464 / BCRC 31852 / DSM 1799) TaxID=573729 RepID=G2Q364_THET4|nr:uncharacterized protein MYCTH_2294987 [Thermothelomyces thermophilus ATCC 42464]AEO53527.1 hypothetical protein MYCTH_2294987 [Thermothelomyces thermophilus ATCC 42464]